MTFRRIAGVEERLGFRSSRLVMFGVIWACVGVSTIAEPLPSHGGRALLLHEMLPPSIQGLAWLLTGCFAAMVGFRRAHDDSLAWAALTIMPTLRLVSWSFAWIAWVVTTVLHEIFGVPVVGFSGGLTGGLIYLAILSLVSSSARHRCSDTVLIPRPPTLPPPPDDPEVHGER